MSLQPELIVRINGHYFRPSQEQAESPLLQLVSSGSDVEIIESPGPDAEVTPGSYRVVEVRTGDPEIYSEEVWIPADVRIAELNLRKAGYPVAGVKLEEIGLRNPMPRLLDRT